MRNYLILFLSFTLIAADPTDIQTFADDNNQFAASVYNQLLLDNKDNILVSAFSAETVLALVQSGAIGETGQEIRRSLNLPSTEEETESLMRTVLPVLSSKKYSLKTANKIYVEDNFPVREQFTKTASSVYQAAFENIEFASNLGAAQAINDWVKAETAGKIQDLVSPDDLNEDTRLVLVNALYFKANWTIPFAPSPRKLQFFKNAEETVQIDTLFKESGLYKYYDSQELDAQFLEIPFDGEDASMTFILPNKRDGIAILEKQVRGITVAPKYTREFVQVSLPKFRIESKVDFKDVLIKLGVKKAFDASQADFSGIAGNKGDLLIGSIIQKTFIEVAEGGVEAAAATEVTVFTRSEIISADKKFIADHPFMFYIKVKDIILFEGRVTSPEF